MRLKPHKFGFILISLCVLLPVGGATQPCDMGTVKSGKRFQGSIPLGSRNVPYDAGTTFQFQPNGEGLVKITQITRLLCFGYG